MATTEPASGLTDDPDASFDALVSDDVREKFEALFASFDLKRGLRRLAFGGFDSYEDYVRYGDMYVGLTTTPSGIRRRMPLSKRGTPQGLHDQRVDDLPDLVDRVPCL